ncbi:3-oxoacyl-[acyl-carrier-protein] synthase [Anopheles darlingi]|uniref:3-oxoacyl-[acyl-carrier-protein] synthase n=1 Tax=Anopheles darlingi TaxID=43151 RepID=W5JGA4_ANODA|nr:3-oxoacyl-[acyl-carrier-protein] synthase [Anopheles darlingi]
MIKGQGRYSLHCASRYTAALIRQQHRSLQTQQTKDRRRRVVITGLGVVSPVGCNVTTAWQTILSGQSKSFTKSELKTMARGTAFALLAAKEALTAASWTPSAEDESACQRTGVAVGMGMVDLQDICDTNEALKKGYNRVSPFFVPRILPNMPAGQLSIKYGFRGPNHAVSTACATGAHSIGDAFRFIRNGDADVMVCGGAEACINPLAIAGFCRLRALSTAFNDDPTASSRPFDEHRDGFVMGEGSAIFVLEELEHARNRGVPIQGEILGYGLSGDASHLTAPRDDGTGAMLAMTRALNDANLTTAEVGYINAHATSTPIGDAIEARSIRTLFGDHTDKVAVSSTKGAHGHLLGAAGNLEALFTLLACRHGVLPPTVNLDSITDDMAGLRFVAKTSEPWDDGRRRVALKNSFGFGGTNACLCIGEYQE